MYPSRVVYSYVCPPLLKLNPEEVPEVSKPVKPAADASDAERTRYTKALQAYQAWQAYSRSVGNSDQYNAKMIAASKIVYDYCDRLFLKQQVQCVWVVRNHAQRILHLPMWPVATERLMITDARGDAYQHERHDPNIVELSAVAPQGTTLQLTYVGGYNETPQPLLYAVGSIMQSLDVHDYNQVRNQKDTVEDSFGKNTVIDNQLARDSVRYDSQYETPLKVIPFAVKQMLNPYKRYTA